MKRLFLTLTLILFVIPLGISQDLPSYVPTDGLVAYYPFNGNANDESGNGNHGTVNGATLTSDRDGNENSSYSFDGVDDDISNSNEFLPLNIDFTISVWFNTNDINQGSQCILNSLEHTGIGLTFNHNYNSSKMNLFLGDGISFWDVNGLGGMKSDYQNDTWYNIILIKQNDLYKVYLNGVVDIETNISNSLNYNNLVGFRFGTISPDSGYEQFFGKIDDIGIWNRALTEQEIQNLYTSSTGDILLNGVVSAENNQIKNVADPTHGKDAVTKSYTDTKFYTQSEVDALIANLQQQINEMNQTITSSELEGNWNVKELYYLNPDTNEITSTFPTPECSKPYQYYEFLASKEIFWTGIGTNWVTQSCTSNEFGVKQDLYTITTEIIYGFGPITYINFPGGSGTRNWEVISRPSENTIIIRAWQNNEITLYNNEVYGLKLVKEARIEQNLN